MIRTIDGFHQDDVTDWVAELSCLHDQHVRHQPLFQDRRWVESIDGRSDRINSEIDCPRCDRAELPDDLVRTRTAGPFDEATLPAGLQRDHRVAERTWGLLRIVAGSAVFTMDTNPPSVIELHAGDTQPIPPGVAHAVQLRGAVQLEVDFFVRP